jgi:hypothetical protein
MVPKPYIVSSPTLTLTTLRQGYLEFMFNGVNWVEIKRTNY